MDEELLFRILFILIYAVFTGVRIYYRRQDIGRESEKQYSQKTIPVIFLSLAIIGYFLSLAVWIVFPTTVSVFQVGIHPVIRWFGVGTAILAIALTLWIHHTLGRQYSALWQIQKEHELITGGPYSRIRHPMYTTLNLFSLSVSLISGSILLIFLSICVALPFPWIARAEEKMLIDQFGEEYLEYMKTTDRFLPLFRKKE